MRAEPSPLTIKIVGGGRQAEGVSTPIELKLFFVQNFRGRERGVLRHPPVCQRSVCQPPKKKGKKWGIMCKMTEERESYCLYFFCKYNKKCHKVLEHQVANEMD